MKFIVKSSDLNNNCEKNIDSGILFQLLTNLQNAGLFKASSKKALTESTIKQVFLSELQEAVNLDAKSNMYALKSLPVTVKGSFDNNGFFAVESVELDEVAYTSPILVHGVNMQRTPGLAQTILNATVENAHPIKVPVNETAKETTETPKVDTPVTETVKVGAAKKVASPENTPVIEEITQDVVKNIKPQEMPKVEDLEVNVAKKDTQQDGPKIEEMKNDEVKNDKAQEMPKVEELSDPEKTQVEKSGFGAWVNTAKNALFSTLPHAVIGATAYLFRNPIIAGITSFAARIGLAAVSAFVTPISVVFAAVGLSAVFSGVREWFKRSKAESYEAKTEEQFKALSPDHVNAFLDGVAAQKSYVAQAKTCFSFNDYRHGNAFYAGMGAAAENKNELIEKIKQCKPQA